MKQLSETRDTVWRRCIQACAAVALVGGLGGGIASAPVPAKAEGYDMDCAVILCLAGGFPTGCGAAYSYMIRRITSVPPKPPFGFCAMGSISEVDFPDNDDPAAFEAMLGEIDAPGVVTALRSVRAEVYRYTRMCQRGRDEEYRCTNTIALNGDGSDLFWGDISGWRRGNRVTFQDYQGKSHAIGSAESYSVTSTQCHGGRDPYCTHTFGWVPIATPAEEYVPEAEAE